MAPLNEATEFNGSREWCGEIVPPCVRGPNHGVTRSAATEKVAEIRRKLETSLSAEIHLPAI